SACGYRFAGGGKLPGDVTRIAVEILDNRSGETGIENIITNDIINEFTRRGNVEISSKKAAEAVLSGVIQSAKATSVSNRSAYTTAEREVTVRVDLKMTDSTGKIIWSAKGIEAAEDYIVLSEKIRTEQNKKSAIVDLSERLAQRIYYRLTDQF
ncbi:MAG: LPS assembly lipoprotein LptE, partial [Thermodesulfobacteriota bacterium]